MGFGAKQPVAEVALTLAKLREATALTGDGRGDGARRLERRPEVEREGERGERVSGGGRRRRRWRPKEERLGALYIAMGGRDRAHIDGKNSGKFIFAGKRKGFDPRNWKEFPYKLLRIS